MVLAQDQAQYQQSARIETERQYKKDLAKYEQDLKAYEAEKKKVEEQNKKAKEKYERDLKIWQAQEAERKKKEQQSRWSGYDSRISSLQSQITSVKEAREKESKREVPNVPIDKGQTSSRLYWKSQELKNLENKPIGGRNQLQQQQYRDNLRAEVKILQIELNKSNQVKNKKMALSNYTEQIKSLELQLSDVQRKKSEAVAEYNAKQKRESQAKSAVTSATTERAYKEAIWRYRDSEFVSSRKLTEPYMTPEISYALSQHNKAIQSGSRGRTINRTGSKAEYLFMGGTSSNWNEIIKAEDANRKMALRQSAGLRASGNRQVQASIDAELKRLGGSSTSGPTKISGTLNTTRAPVAKGTAAIAQPWEKGFTVETRAYGYIASGQAEIDRQNEIKRIEAEKTMQAQREFIEKETGYSIENQLANPMLNRPIFTEVEMTKTVPDKPMTKEERYAQRVANVKTEAQQRDQALNAFAELKKPQEPARFTPWISGGKGFFSYDTATSYVPPASQEKPSSGFALTGFREAELPKNVPMMLGALYTIKTKDGENLKDKRGNELQFMTKTSADKYIERVNKAEYEKAMRDGSYIGFVDGKPIQGPPAPSYQVTTKTGIKEFSTYQKAEEFIANNPNKLATKEDTRLFPWLSTNQTEEAVIPPTLSQQAAQAKYDKSAFKIVDDWVKRIEKNKEVPGITGFVSSASSELISQGVGLYNLIAEGDQYMKRENPLRPDLKRPNYTAQKLYVPKTYTGEFITGVIDSGTIEGGLAKGGEYWKTLTPEAQAGEAVGFAIPLAATGGVQALKTVTPFRYIAPVAEKAAIKATPKTLAQKIASKTGTVELAVPGLLKSRYLPVRVVQPKILLESGVVKPAFTELRVGYGKLSTSIGGKAEKGFYRSSAKFKDTRLPYMRGSQALSSFDTYQVSHYNMDEIRALTRPVIEGEEFGKFTQGKWDLLLKERQTAIDALKKPYWKKEYVKTIPKGFLKSISEGIIEPKTWKSYFKAQREGYISKAKGSGVFNLIKGGVKTKIGDVDAMAKNTAKAEAKIEKMQKDLKKLREGDEVIPARELKDGTMVPATTKNAEKIEKLQGKIAKAKAELPGMKAAQLILETETNPRFGWTTKGSNVYIQEFEDVGKTIPRGEPKEVFNFVTGKETITSAIGDSVDTAKFYGKTYKTGTIKVGFEGAGKTEKIEFQDLMQQNIDLKGSISGISSKDTIKQFKGWTPELESKLFPRTTIPFKGGEVPVVRFGLPLQHRVKDIVRSYFYADREMARIAWKYGDKEFARRIGKQMQARYEAEKDWLNWREEILNQKPLEITFTKFNKGKGFQETSGKVVEGTKGGSTLIVDVAGKTTLMSTGDGGFKKINFQTAPVKTNKVKLSSPKTPIRSPGSKITSVSTSPKVTSVRSSPTISSPSSPRITSPSSPKSPRVSSPKSPRSPSSPRPKSPKILSPRSPKSPASPKSPRLVSPKSPSIRGPSSVTTTSPKRRIVAPIIKIRSAEKKSKDDPTKRKDFLGNVKTDNIVGIFKRKEILVGDKKTAKQLRKDKKVKVTQGGIWKGSNKDTKKLRVF